MSISSPSDDDVRAKAYELWCAGGMQHGRDKEDWIRAKGILSAAARDPAAQPPIQSMAQVMVEGVLGAAGLAVGAAAAAMSSVLGTRSAEPTTSKPQPTGSPPIPAAALEAAERKLEVAAEARLQRTKTEAAGTPSSAGSMGKVNPDG